MRRARRLERGLLVLACLGMIVPVHPLLAAAAGETTKPELNPPTATVNPPTATVNPPTATVNDVALHADGVLAGRVLDTADKPQASARVTVRHRDQDVAIVTTDRMGRFFVRGLDSGVHELAVGESRTFCRVWAPSTAPPAAQRGVTLVVGKRQVRGQSAGNCSWLTNPYTLVGILMVATAIAVPVAIHNSKKPASP